MPDMEILKSKLLNFVIHFHLACFRFLVVETTRKGNSLLKTYLSTLFWSLKLSVTVQVSIQAQPIYEISSAFCIINYLSQTVDAI